MSTPTSGFGDSGFRLADAPPNLCEPASAFSTWADGLVEAAVQKQTVVAIHQAVLLLTQRYFTWRDSVPKRHRMLSGVNGGHICIFAVFEAYYRRLREAELALEPPPLAVAPVVPLAPRTIPATPQRTRFDGLLIGDLEPDPEFG